MAAASDATVADDGRLCVGGLADPTEGDVTVSLVISGGNVIQQTATVDGATCRWSTCFTGLTEGSVLVEAEQNGDRSVTEGIGVP